ncbi:MAG: hypothetical protein RBU37_19735 [Myxococcota bacterium]|jgi:hypothetical protein|nr:hypothetical protein [Myxococcota bacterium]
MESRQQLFDVNEEVQGCGASFDTQSSEGLKITGGLSAPWRARSTLDILVIGDVKDGKTLFGDFLFHSLGGRLPEGLNPSERQMASWFRNRAIAKDTLDPDSTKDSWGIVHGLLRVSTAKLVKPIPLTERLWRQGIMSACLGGWSSRCYRWSESNWHCSRWRGPLGRNGIDAEAARWRRRTRALGHRRGTPESWGNANGLPRFRRAVESQTSHSGDAGSPAAGAGVQPIAHESQLF